MLSGVKLSIPKASYESNIYVWISISFDSFPQRINQQRWKKYGSFSHGQTNNQVCFLISCLPAMTGSEILCQLMMIWWFTL